MQYNATFHWGSMCKRFLKLNLDNEEADFLAIHHPNAFILLYFIARRARRIPDQPDGLKVGECHIGDWEKIGLSRQNYRTALKILCAKKFVEILETNRTRKKSTTGLTTEGTKVKLLNSTIWNINTESPNHSTNHCLTTDQPLPNHEQERRRIISISDDIDYNARTAKRPRSKDFLSFDFEKWEFIGITEKDMSDWKLMYPHIDIQVETLKAAQWLKNNPSKSGKTHWRKYLTGWLGRSNDSVENKKAFRVASGGSTPDRRTKNMDGTPIKSRAEDLF